MATQSTNHPDDVREAEFLLGLYRQMRQDQQQQFTDLQTKITFLFGFIVAVITLYGTYGTHTNGMLRSIALCLLAISLLLLCWAFVPRIFNKSEKPDTTIGTVGYFSKLYEELVSIEDVYSEDEKPLVHIGRWLTVAVCIFTLAVVSLALSFVWHTPAVVNSTHEQCTIATTKTKSQTESTISKVCRSW